MVFVQKRRLSFFSHWLIMERSQNWPDLRSPISKFRDFIDTGTFHRYWYGYQSLKVSRWSVIRCSYDEHSIFFLRWGHLTCPGDLTLYTSEILQIYALGIHLNLYEVSRRVSELLQKKKQKGEGKKCPPPHGRIKMSQRVHCVDCWYSMHKLFIVIRVLRVWTDMWENHDR